MTGIDLAGQFARLESEVSRHKGEFALFALFQREEVPGRWDLIVSAPWIGADKNAAVDYFVDQIKSYLGPDKLTVLSRIVIVSPENSAVEALNRAIHVEHGNTEVRDSNFFGLPIKHAFIITSKRPGAPVAN